MEGTPFWVEAKNWKRCNIQGAVDQATEVTDGRPILVVSKDLGKRELATMYLDDFMDLLRKAYGNDGV